MVKILLDSADLGEIKTATEWKIIDGITTNPTLIKKAVEARRAAGQNEVDLEAHVKDIFSAIGADKPVSLEVDCADAATMIAQGEALYARFKDAGNAVIKVPINPDTDPAKPNYDGITTIKHLSRSSIPVNVTLVFSVEQALLAYAAGAAYVSPFCGRMDDLLKEKINVSLKALGGLNEEVMKNPYWPAKGLGDHNYQGIKSGVDLVRKIRKLYDRMHRIPSNSVGTQILAASIRTPRQFYECALAGADCITAPYTILQRIIAHPKSAEGVVIFKKDMAGVPEWQTLMQPPK